MSMTSSLLWKQPFWRYAAVAALFLFLFASLATYHGNQSLPRLQVTDLTTSKVTENLIDHVFNFTLGVSLMLVLIS